MVNSSCISSLKGLHIQLTLCMQNVKTNMYSQLFQGEITATNHQQFKLKGHGLEYIYMYIIDYSYNFVSKDKVWALKRPVSH